MEWSMPETNRLTGGTNWIDLEFVERERTPESIIEVGIQLHLAGLSLSNTKQHLEKLVASQSGLAFRQPRVLSIRCPAGFWSVSP